MDFVPIIDLSTRDSAALAEAIGTACATSGFFTTVGRWFSDRMRTTYKAA